MNKELIKKLVDEMTSLINHWKKTENIHFATSGMYSLRGFINQDTISPSLLESNASLSIISIEDREGHGINEESELGHFLPIIYSQIDSMCKELYIGYIQYSQAEYNIFWDREKMRNELSSTTIPYDRAISYFGLGGMNPYHLDVIGNL